MKNLQLSLKTKWFEMTKAGIKTEDYREINEYWVKRLIGNKFNEDYTIQDFIHTLKNDMDNSRFVRLYQKRFTQNTVTLGYPKKDDKERILILEHKGIEIRTGNPEWGAEEGKLYFVIKHGKIQD